VTKLKIGILLVIRSTSNFQRLFESKLNSKSEKMEDITEFGRRKKLTVGEANSYSVNLMK